MCCFGGCQFLGLAFVGCVMWCGCEADLLVVDLLRVVCVMLVWCWYCGVDCGLWFGLGCNIGFTSFVCLLLLVLVWGCFGVVWVVCDVSVSET